MREAACGRIRTGFVDLPSWTWLRGSALVDLPHGSAQSGGPPGGAWTATRSGRRGGDLAGHGAGRLQSGHVARLVGADQVVPDLRRVEVRSGELDPAALVHLVDGLLHAPHVHV